MNRVNGGDKIPDRLVLKDYRKIFFAMKKILDHSYEYPYQDTNNESYSFAQYQSVEIGDNIVIDKIVQNTDRIVDGTQKIIAIDDSMMRYYLYISLSKKAIEPSLNGRPITEVIANFFMAHELSHIIYRKLAEKVYPFISSKNLQFLFRPDFELNMRPGTQNKETICDIFGIIILWVASLIDEKRSGFTTIRALMEIFGNLTVDSINNRSPNPEIVFLFNEFRTGSETHPSCAKRLLTIKYLVNRLNTLPKTDSIVNLFNLCTIGIETLNIFNKLNSGREDYSDLRGPGGYIEYNPIPINDNWNRFEFRRQLGGSKTKNTKHHQTKKTNKNKKPNKKNKPNKKTNKKNQIKQ